MSGLERGGADGTVDFFRKGDTEDGDGEGEKGCIGADGAGEMGGEAEALGVSSCIAPDVLVYSGYRFWLWIVNGKQNVAEAMHA